MDIRRLFQKLKNGWFVAHDVVGCSACENESVWVITVQKINKIELFEPHSRVYS